MNDLNGGIDENYRLIITIVKKGIASKVVAATKKAGVEGGTILMGRGTADQNLYLKFFGIDNEPEREIILTLVRHEMVDPILAVITKEAHLDKPDKGIGFVMRVKQLSGIVHLLGMQDLKG